MIIYFSSLEIVTELHQSIVITYAIPCILLKHVVFQESLFYDSDSDSDSDSDRV